jgi:Pvc16 N-terminal domain
MWEHVLLAWTMRALADTPVLSSALLNRWHAGAFEEDETIELILEDLSLADALNLGRQAGGHYRLGVSYAAQVALIGSSGTIQEQER